MMKAWSVDFSFATCSDVSSPRRAITPGAAQAGRLPVSASSSV